MKKDYKFVSYHGIKLKYQVKKNPKANNKQWLLLLHGFSGSSVDWEFLLNNLFNYNVIAPDIIGHGRSEAPEANYFYEFNNVVSQIELILAREKAEQIIPIGYSMGGRFAIALAGAHPELIKGLILESTTPGIRLKKERLKRIQEDEILAEKILKGELTDFFERWFNKEIFKWDERFDKKRIQQIIIQRSKNSAIGLFNILKESGTGRMPYFLNSLKKLNAPILLITGEEDKKFTTLNKTLAGKLTDATHIIVKGCGHNVHLEKPEIFINLVKTFLKNLERGKE